MRVKTFNLSLPNKLVHEIDKIAEHEYRSRSELIREALRHYLKKIDENEGIWETVVDFTTINKEGVKIEEVIKRLKQMNG